MRIIVEGSFMIGRKHYTAGEMRVQEAGQYYGPEVSQETGAKQIIVFANRQDLWSTFANPKERDPFVSSGALDRVAEFYSPVMGPGFYVVR
jgi:hypothetical protein